MKKNLFFNVVAALSFILLVSNSSFGHFSLLPDINDEDYQVALDHVPVPVGGYESVMKKIVYPEMALKTRLEGKVYVMVYIDESGSVNEAKIVRGLGGGCDEEAVKVIKKSKFVPATSKGTVVKAKFAVALSFKVPA